MTDNSAPPEARSGNWFRGVDETAAMAAMRGLVLRTLGGFTARAQFACFLPEPYEPAGRPFQRRGFDQQAQSYGRAIADLGLALKRLCDKPVVEAEAGVMDSALAVETQAMFWEFAQHARAQAHEAYKATPSARQEFEARLAKFALQTERKALREDPDYRRMRAKMPPMPGIEPSELGLPAEPESPETELRMPPGSAAPQAGVQMPSGPDSGETEVRIPGPAPFEQKAAPGVAFARPLPRLRVVGPDPHLIPESLRPPNR